MEDDFYTGRLSTKYALKVLTPPKEDRDLVHRVVFDELVLGIVTEGSRRELLRIIGDLQARGAEGVIEGCTELAISVRQEHTAIPLFDTTALHVDQALGIAFE
jgi:aspartate racemase